MHIWDSESKFPFVSSIIWFLCEWLITYNTRKWLKILYVKSSWYLQCQHVLFTFLHSSYPSARSKKDSEGVESGVVGTVDLLQNVTLSTQPISSFDWSPDKTGLSVCTSFDQTIRVIITTKLNTLWKMWVKEVKIWMNRMKTAYVILLVW